MKKFFFVMLYVLAVATFLVSVIGVVAYTANINQNAFALCELVVCLYCAVSVLMKAVLVKRSKQAVDSSKEQGTEKSDSSQSDESNH